MSERRGTSNIQMHDYLKHHETYHYHHPNYSVPLSPSGTGASGGANNAGYLHQKYSPYASTNFHNRLMYSSTSTIYPSNTAPVSARDSNRTNYLEAAKSMS